MPDRPVIQQTYTPSNPAGAAEAVIATVGSIVSLQSNDTLKFFAFAVFAPAASTTSAILKIRRDSLTGTVVATSPTFNGGDITTPKRNTYFLAGTDSPVDLAGASYVLTLTLAAAGGATTIDAVFLECRCD